MASSAEHAAVTYGAYTPSDADEIARLLAEVFTERDPPAVAAGLTLTDFETFVSLLCARDEGESLTIIARSAANGEMIGALLTEDSASSPPVGMDRLSEKRGERRATRLSGCGH